MFIKQIQYILIASLLLVLPTGAWAESEVWKSFVEYKESLESYPKNVGSYFSKAVNEEWFRYLFKQHSSQEDALATLGAVRSRATFARRVKYIYRLAEDMTSKDAATLSFIFKKPDETGPYTYTIGYVREGVAWKINLVALDTTKPEGAVPQEPIHVFR